MIRFDPWLWYGINRSVRNGLDKPKKAPSGVEPLLHSARNEPVCRAFHAPATTGQLIEWLRNPEMTITSALREEIADRLVKLKKAA